MTERALSRGPYAVRGVRSAAFAFGEGTIIVMEDGVVTITSGDGRTIRWSFAQIDGVVAASDRLEVTLRDRSVATVDTAAADDLLVDLLAQCRAMPEVTRTLRAFGSGRRRFGHRDAGADEQRRFFAPFMDARRRAGRELAPLHIIAAFDVAALRQALDDTLNAFAVERYPDSPPARRALEAELSDIAEPLHVALDLLQFDAEAARGDIDDLRLWRRWAAQLRDAFETADRVWVAIDRALDAPLFAP